MDRSEIEGEIRLLDVQVLEIEALVAQQQHVIGTLEKIGRNANPARTPLLTCLPYSAAERPSC